MENKSGFDVNQAVAKWLNQFRGHESIGADEAREFESHLRDAIAVWMDKGLTEEEAFLIETRRVGRPAALALEFQTEDPRAAWRNRVYWVVMGLMMMLALIEVTKAALAVASYTLAWQWYPEEFRAGAVVTELRFGDPDVGNFLEMPTHFFVWVALLTPLALSVALRLRSRAALNPHSDLYRLTRTRLRTAITLATIITLTSLIQWGADSCGETFFYLAPNPQFVQEFALNSGYAWILALLAISADRKSLLTYQPTAVRVD